MAAIESELHSAFCGKLDSRIRWRTSRRSVREGEGRSRRTPWREERAACAGEMPRVSGDERETESEGRRRDHFIWRANDNACPPEPCGELAPGVRDLLIERQDPVIEAKHDVGDDPPHLELSVTLWQQGNAALQFADGDDAYEDVVFSRGVEPAQIVPIRRWSAELTDGVGVEEETQSSRSRTGVWSLFRSTPSRSSCRRRSLKPRGMP